MSEKFGVLYQNNVEKQCILLAFIIRIFPITCKFKHSPAILLLHAANLCSDSIMKQIAHREKEKVGPIFTAVGVTRRSI